MPRSTLVSPSVTLSSINHFKKEMCHPGYLGFGNLLCNFILLPWVCARVGRDADGGGGRGAGGGRAARVSRLVGFPGPAMGGLYSESSEHDPTATAAAPGSRARDLGTCVS